MTVGTRINHTEGVVTTRDSDEMLGFGPYRQNGVTSITAVHTMSLNEAGAFLVTGTATQIPIVMPSASQVPGAIYTFRGGLNPMSFFLTGSKEVAGTAVPFVIPSGSVVSGAFSGSQLEVTGTVGGGSVALLCDGAHFLVIGSSGTIFIRNT
jgi:hypothetical protein